MQLGDLLKAQPGVPCVVRRVRFQLLHLVGGLEHKTDAEALLVPVSDVLSGSCERLAREFLERLDPDPESPYRWRAELGPGGGETREVPGAPIPREVLAAEESRVFLRLCLRDVEKPLQPFVRERDHAVFRRALIPRQVEWLQEEYSRFLDEEYPETPSRAQRRALAEEAEGK